MRLLVPILFTLAWIALIFWTGACGGGGGGGGGGSSLPLVVSETEPNNVIAEASPFPAGGIAVGTVETAGDLDVWSFNATAGQTLQFELFAHRQDQVTWEGACSRPGFTVVKSLSEPLRGHLDPTGGGLGWTWPGGWGDLDIPFLHVTETRTYYIVVAALPYPSPGGPYAIRVRSLALGPLQFEAETAPGDNDFAFLAEALSPGALVGHAGLGDTDWYSIDVSAPARIHCDLTACRAGIWQDSEDYFDPVMVLYRVDGVTIVGGGEDTFFEDPAFETRVVDPGTYLLQIRNTGARDGFARYLLKYTLSPDADTPEIEPNDVFGDATPMAYGSFVSGSLDAGDVDWYSFSGQAGDMVRLWNYDRRNCGGTFANVLAQLYDTDGITLLPQETVPFGPTPTLNAARAILPRTGTYYVSATPGGATDYALRLERFKDALWESEPNDDLASADPLNAGGRAAGAISTPGDVDAFEFMATAGEFVQIAAYARRGVMDGAHDLSGHGSLLMPAVLVQNPLGDFISGAWNFYPGGAGCVRAEGIVDPLPTATCSFVTPFTGRHTLMVIDIRGDAGDDHTYVIERR